MRREGGLASAGPGAPVGQKAPVSRQERQNVTQGSFDVNADFSIGRRARHVDGLFFLSRDDIKTCPFAAPDEFARTVPRESLASARGTAPAESSSDHLNGASCCINDRKEVTESMNGSVE